MDFTFTSEQTQLADAVKRMIASEYSFEARKKIVHSKTGTSNEIWGRLAELGLLALPMPEAQDGFGGTAIDMLLVMQELGRGLLVEPYFATIFAAEFIKRLGNPEQQAMLARVASGEVKLAAALLEKQSRHDLMDVQTSALSSDGGYTLSGTKTVVIHGARAQELIVSARTSGSSREARGISLFVVPITAAGLAVREYRTIDGLRGADITLTEVKVDAAALLGTLGNAADTIDAVSDYGVALLCAEAVGAMETLHAQTVEYTKTRKQFGQPIAKFQALQHRMVEMFMHLEQARSMAYLAAVRVASDDAALRRRSVSAAKVRVGQAMRYLGQQAIQLHGGMGVTDELPAAHYFKRLSMIELTLGDTDHHLTRFIAQPAERPIEVALKKAA